MNVDEVTQRVRAEFEEMPGLALTVPQAAKLFGIDARSLPPGIRATDWRVISQTDARRRGRPRRTADDSDLPRSALRPVDVRRLAEEHFGRLHRASRSASDADEWSASGRCVRAHLDRQHAFGDQLAGAGADEADAEDALGLRIEDQLRQAVDPVERDRAA